MARGVQPTPDDDGNVGIRTFKCHHKSRDELEFVRIANGKQTISEVVGIIVDEWARNAKSQRMKTGEPVEL